MTAPANIDVNILVDALRRGAQTSLWSGRCAEVLTAFFSTPAGIEYLEREEAAKRGGFQGLATPDPSCAEPNEKPCANCNCWKFTREMCS